MRALVTGATGFVSRSLVKRLEKPVMRGDSLLAAGRASGCGKNRLPLPPPGRSRKLCGRSSSDYRTGTRRTSSRFIASFAARCAIRIVRVLRPAGTSISPSSSVRKSLSSLVANRRLIGRRPRGGDHSPGHQTRKYRCISRFLLRPCAGKNSAATRIS